MYKNNYYYKHNNNHNKMSNIDEDKIWDGISSCEIQPVFTCGSPVRQISVRMCRDPSNPHLVPFVSKGNEDESNKNTLNKDTLNEEEFDEKDISLVQSQAECTREIAIKMLKKHDGDIVNAIMDLVI